MKRLDLALEKLKPSQWEQFERFASEFLVIEMPDLRTVASPSGDGGRDAELFSPAGDNTQVLQYSVTEDWAGKIRQTAARISKTMPTAQLLIYVTNQTIGAGADDLKKELRTKYHLHLDVRSRSYFLERRQRDHRTEAAAESLAQEIVDPYLSAEGVVSRRPTILESNEAKAAHVYLSLQLRDEESQKGLTKLSFDALVRSVLIHTNSEKRMPRSEVKQLVRQLLPDDGATQVDQLTDSALARLTKNAVRHWIKEDEFCLTHEEGVRLAEYLATQELAESELASEIRRVTERVASPSGDGSVAHPELSAIRVRRILERSLYNRADSFASAVLAGNTAAFSTDHIQEIIIDDLRVNPVKKGDAEGNPGWLAVIVREILSSTSDPIRAYLRDLADAYSLLAFLRQTPDVQSAVRKIFSHGEIWLDTSAILPLLAEELLEEGNGSFQQMVRTATSAGISFHVTEGVIEELDRHINRSLMCSRLTDSWDGQIPFLLEAFLQTGRSVGEFHGWVERLRGPHRPIDDIFEFLHDEFGIRRRDLDAIAQEAPEDLRHAVQEAWFRIHSRRRERAGQTAELIAVSRLSKHDTENYVGVIQQRKKETASPLGYSAWWLTLDRQATMIAEAIERDFGVPPPDSPVLSLDFLAQYLTLGPTRPRVPKSTLRMLPITFEPKLVRFLTTDLLKEASAIREEMKNLPERIVRRRVRDHLDSARRRIGPMAVRGADVFFDEIAH